MYFKPLSFLFCLFSITLFVNATSNTSDHHPAVSKDQRYIVQLKPTTDIENFIPNLLKGIFDLIGDVIDDIGDFLEDATHLDDSKKLAKRTNPVQVFDSFDIDGSFKALSTRIEKDSLLGSMLSHFDEIVGIIPDEVIKFDLPKPQSLRRRYYMRHTPDNVYAEGKLVKNSSSAQESSTKNATNPHTLQQKNAPWNLARITQRKPDPKAPYVYPESSGEGVRIYVIDDGVNKDHKDFDGRVSWGFSAIGNDSTTQIGGGHGTHVSGIIGGQEYGVAKNVTIVSVQVLKKNGEGSVSSLLSGVQWVVKDAKKHAKKSIVNMSLGIPSIAPSADTLDQAITAAAKGGLPIIVASGNSASDACEVVPAGNPNVYTVAASDKTDTLDPRSCYGKCVAITAPGVNVESDYIGGNNATATMSGTSMAAPHVTGIAALILQDLDDPSPKSLFAALTSFATKNVIKENRPHTVNLLAFNKVDEPKKSNQTTTTTKKQPKKKSDSKKKSSSNKKSSSKD
ncbi:peptidase S8/S53 domain-containing protein [Absidia repens]|uniref:Peptidase S8/S53 domain-containing protein n=1 Tax=Absidia repens TaxID=90262 RepID=A0A1X2IT94_9FUNG|nr:peptidase S8/S53 domain-containing protein [Absidia repens]